MREGTDLNIQIEGFVVIHQNLPGLWVAKHSHPHHELFIPLAGSLQVRVENNLWNVVPGQMLWLEGNAAHTFETSTSDEGERLILMFDPSCWQRNKGVAKPSCVLPAHQLIKEVAFYMLAHPKSNANSALTSAVVTCISEMLSATTGNSPDTFNTTVLDTRVQVALEFMKKNYTQEISVDDIANQAEVTTRTLNRLFQAELNITPKQLLTKHRIQEACRLLRETNLSVTNVAFESGFGSLSSFIESFRNQVGVLPSDYKRNLVG